MAVRVSIAVPGLVSIIVNCTRGTLLVLLVGLRLLLARPLVIRYDVSIAVIHDVAICAVQPVGGAAGALAT